MKTYFIHAIPLWWNMLFFFWIPLVAVALDILVPYPAKLLHPVQGIGKFAKTIESHITKTKASAFTQGLWALILVCLLTSSIVSGFMSIPYFVGCVLALYCSWTGLALGQLVREGKKCLALITAAEAEQLSVVASANNLDFQEANDIPTDDETINNTASVETPLQKARNAVGMLVSRDTQEMDINDLYKTLAESMSENFTDAFIAPLFWLCFTGPIGLWIYKAVSTLDSMWGYKNTTYIMFGKASARTDDALAYIPARLAAFFLFLVAPALKLHGNWPGWDQIRQQAHLMASPNAGWTMATCAWLHKSHMGGKFMYHGELVKKPILGPLSGNWNGQKLTQLFRHMLVAGVTGAIMLILTSALLASIVLM